MIVVSVCKLTLDKKCCTSLRTHCRGSSEQTQVNTAAQGGNNVIGAPLISLLQDGSKIPLIIEQLIQVIELNGLYTVGLYRKAGAAGKIKQLIKDINSGKKTLAFT